jgi:hypothetical protein
MSQAKARQIRDLAQIPMGEKYNAVQYQTPLHCEAFAFNMIIYNGLWLKANPHTVPSKQKNPMILLSRK